MIKHRQNNHHAAGLKTVLAGIAVVAAAWVLLLVSGGTAAAQSGVEWDLTLGGEGDDFAHAVIQTSDGGYIVVGETGSSGSGRQDVWLIRIGADGTEEWSKTYGGPEDDIGYDVQQTADGGYIIAAETQSFGVATAATSDFWLIKTDAAGDPEWDQTYDRVDLQGPLGVPDSEVPHAVQKSSDSGFIVAGSTGNGRQRNAWLVKTASNGSVEWSQEFGGDLDDNAYGVLEAADGGFVFAGKTDSFSTGGSDYWLVKTDSSGAEEWSNTFGGPYNDEARALTQANDGGYALVGFSWSFGSGLSDYWLVKTDSSGQPEWERPYGGVPRDSAHSLQQTSDGGYLLAGWSESFPGGDQFWVVRTGATGVWEWRQTYGSPGGARSSEQTADGGYILAGWTGPLEEVRDIRVIKIAAHDQPQPSPAGPVVVLENTGRSPITAAAVGFNIPDQSGSHRFFFRGSPLGEDNPLPSESQACTLPIDGINRDTHLVMDQVGSRGSVYIDEVTAKHSAPRLGINSDGFSFEREQDDAEGGPIGGSYRLVSTSPCQTARAEFWPPVPTGLAIAPFPTKSGTLELEWDDNRSLGIDGYDVYVSPSPTGPFRRTATLEPESKHIQGGLENGQSYYFAVTAVDDRGRGSALSAVAEGVPFDLAPPEAPSGLSLQSADQAEGTSRLIWSQNPAPDLRSYRVYRQDGDGLFQSIATLGRTTRHVDHSLPMAGRYTYVVTAIDQAGNESGYSNLAPPDLDFFGTIIRVEPDSADGGLLVIKTGRGVVEAPVTAETSIRLPYQPEAKITDLVRGDEVAVTLMESSGRLVADQVHLIPSRAINRHVAGDVTTLTATLITVQPPGTEQAPVTFRISPATTIEWYQGKTELAEGSYVIVSTVSQPVSVDTPLLANVINVTSGRSPAGDAADEETAVLATVRGVLLDINPETGDLMLETFEIALDQATVIADGLVAGDIVVIVAELKSDNSLLARSVMRDEPRESVVEHTYVEGTYQRTYQDVGGPNGRWLVGGIEVTVDDRTLTDGQPANGQRVRVKAIVQDDGSLLARDVVNLPRSAIASGSEEMTRIEGAFQGVQDDGAWIIGGLPIAVATVTGMEGIISVGRRVAIEAVMSEGVLTARTVFSIERESVGEARIRGTVDQVLEDGSLVIDGVPVVLSTLTESQIELEVGASVEIKALLTPDGVLVARVVADLPGEDRTSETQANRVDIEGRVERVFQDGGLIVNGIRVVTSPLSVIEGEILAGVRVQVRGMLQPTGAVLAREIQRHGSRAIDGAFTFRVEGVLERIIRGADGAEESLALRGVTLAVDELTWFEPGLQAGGPVIILAMVAEEGFLAITVESQPIPSVLGNAEVQFQGTVESVRRVAAGAIVSLFVQGVEVTLRTESRILGRLAAGETVEIKGVFEEGAVFAEEIRGAAQDTQEVVPSPFELEGVVENVRRDQVDNVIEVSVNGQTITVEPLTVINGELELGSQVAVEGVIRAQELLAAVITVTAGPNDLGDGPG